MVQSRIPDPPEGRNSALRFPPGVEWRMVFELARAFFGLPLARDLLEEAGRGVDWERALEVASVHGVAGICHDALHRLSGPKPALQQGERTFRQARRVAAYRSVRLMQELREILTSLDGCGVHPVLLKGASLALRVYPDPALRPMGDLDLLVRQEELPAATEALAALGYEACGVAGTAWAQEQLQAHLPTFVAPGRVNVDIHFRLFGRAVPLFPDEAGVRERLARTPMGGKEVLLLSPADELLYLCGHLRKHASSEYRLIWFCDLALMDQRLQEPERARFEELLAACRPAWALHHPLHTARLWFEGREGTDGQGLEEVLASPFTAEARLAPEALDRMTDLLGQMSGWRPWVRFVLGYLFPRLEYLKQYHRVEGRWSAWGWRLLRPLWAANRLLRYALARTRGVRRW